MTSTPSPREVMPRLTEVANALGQPLTATINGTRFTARPTMQTDSSDGHVLKARVEEEFPGMTIAVENGGTPSADRVLAALAR
ncbi:MAG: hypothetical protein H6922_03740 [Pseudomonadaceae bacterium]|nr:hypothetical protein [Pseudomonadaceae bacterium]